MKFKNDKIVCSFSQKEQTIFVKSLAMLNKLCYTVSINLQKFGGNIHVSISYRRDAGFFFAS